MADVDPMISKQAFEHQLNCLKIRDTGIISANGTMKAWVRPDGSLIVLSNRDWVPYSTMMKVLDEVDRPMPGLYRQDSY